MKHIDEDRLLKFTLELLDKVDSEIVSEHLKECKTCSQKYEKIMNEVDLIGSFNPDIESNIIPIPRKNSTYSIWLTRAAVLLIGFLLGYSTSNMIQHKPVRIVAQTFIPKNSQIDSSKFIECPNVDIYSEN